MINIQDRTMIKYTIRLFIAMLLLGGLAQGAFAQMSDVKAELKKDVSFLSSDDLEGRLPGTLGEVKAAEYISERMEEIGILPKGTEGYLQKFSFTPLTNPHGPSRSDRAVGARNVVGFIDNGAASTVVIGAHYDHLGYGSVGSLHTGERAIHNGADDNASGVAMMLSLGKYLKQSDLKNNNYLFIAFSGEEQGLLGSNYFVNNPTIPIESINYMVNMDMVGRLQENNTISIGATGTAAQWEQALEAANHEELIMVYDPSGNGPSDYSSFCNKGIPALHFFTGQHSDYHKPTDDEEHINYDGMYVIYGLIERVLKDMDDEGKLAFINAQAPSTPGRARFTVTLGVMPDYLYDGEGMRLDGILAGRVAEKAGFQSGDIVIAMDKTEVADIYAYMEALSQYSSGDKAKVVILRDGKKMKKKVVFE